jgi:hypothetical protein
VHKGSSILEGEISPNSEEIHQRGFISPDLRLGTWFL